MAESAVRGQARRLGLEALLVERWRGQGSGLLGIGSNALFATGTGGCRCTGRKRNRNIQHATAQYAATK